MNPSLDSLLVAAAVLAALSYCLWRLFAGRSKSSGCGGGCCPPSPMRRLAREAKDRGDAESP